MADMTGTLDSWSTTSASNQPDNSDTVGPNTLADNQRVIQAVVRQLAASSTIASASTTDLSTINEAFITVSGVTTITAFGTLTAGMWKWLRFSGALTLTHNGTSLILPGAANITTVAGDTALFKSEGSGNWRCYAYLPTSGRSVIKAFLDTEFTIQDDGDTTKQVKFQASGITTGTTRTLTVQDASGTIAYAGANADITSMTAVTAINRTGGTAITGTNTNDSAAAGVVGEYVTAAVLSGSAISLTTATTANITSISLTAGDWDVSGVVSFIPTASTNIGVLASGSSAVSATVSTDEGATTRVSPVAVPGALVQSLALTQQRYSLASTTTIYLIARASFTVSTLTAYGTISARRIR